MEPSCYTSIFNYEVGEHSTPTPPPWPYNQKIVISHALIVIFKTNNEMFIRQTTALPSCSKHSLCVIFIGTVDDDDLQIVK